jgi:hypothetical protein
MEFAFNASALAAGADIERANVITTLPSLGSVMLVPSGGQGRAAVSGYYSAELQLGYAETFVSGRKLPGQDRFATFTSVLMKDVLIFNRVFVGEMGTTISSERGFEEEDDHEFEITIFFDNVRVDGKPVRILKDEDLLKTKRYEDLGGYCHPERFAGSAAAVQDAVRGRQPVRVSLVRDIEGWDTIDLATIFVPGLGRFRFGELMLKPGQRRVNLIHAFFGRRRDRDGREEPEAVQHAVRNTEGPPDLDGSDSDEAAQSTFEPKGEMITGSGEGNGTPIKP